MKPLTLGVIVGNRGFFPDRLAQEGRQKMLDVLHQAGINSVVLTPEDTKFGTVETYADAKKCAELFRRHRDAIDGIIVTLPNFGDERGAAEAIKSAGLNVPILIHAEPDDHKLDIAHRRDSFCGKISVCNNLYQAGIPYSLTQQHVMDAASDEFRRDLEQFAAVCRVVRGLRRVRLGAIGARTGAFNTVRYSEKILEAAHISVETIDLSEILGRIGKLSDKDKNVQDKLQSLKHYIPAHDVPEEALVKMAKFAFIVDDWAGGLDLDGTAIQCWTALQEHFGIMPCTIMSMMSESLRPSACEVDIAGTLSMYALQLASDAPGIILDWNNNYGGDPDKCIVFHCGNLPRSCFARPRMDYNQIIGGILGKDCSWGTISGAIKAGPATFCRLSTDDRHGCIRGYVGEGRFTDDPLDTFGGVGVLCVERLPQLMRFICQEGFEHHVAACFTTQAAAVHEALTRYLGWNIHYHQ